MKKILSLVLLSALTLVGCNESSDVAIGETTFVATQLEQSRPINEETAKPILNKIIESSQKSINHDEYFKNFTWLVTRDETKTVENVTKTSKYQRLMLETEDKEYYYLESLKEGIEKEYSETIIKQSKKYGHIAYKKLFDPYTLDYVEVSYAEKSSDLSSFLVGITNGGLSVTIHFNGYVYGFEDYHKKSVTALEDENIASVSYRSRGENNLIFIITYNAETPGEGVNEYIVSKKLTVEYDNLLFREYKLETETNLHTKVTEFAQATSEKAEIKMPVAWDRLIQK